MTSTSTTELLIRILNEKFHPKSAPARDSTLKALGLDSLDAINFLFSVEEETGVAIPDEAIAEKGLKTLGDFAGFVDEARAARGVKG
jgi:acyl carrier protein